MNWISLALSSLWNRKATVALTLVMVSMSVCLLLSVDRARTDTRNSFSNTLSGADLLVGARTGSLNLLLYSVFRIGNATNNISWESYQTLKAHKDVAWTIPISLGDSHRGYRVVGTNEDYLKHYQYGRKKPLSLAQGVWFTGVFEVVLGSAVASELNYVLGQEIVIAHGTGSTSFEQHDDRPFTVVGILNATGTPVDKSLHISLEGITALHVDWQSGVKRIGKSTSVAETLDRDLTPEAITAFLVGMNSRLDVFSFQRQINDYRREALLAVIPGAALQELWQLIAIAENALMAVSVMVIVTGLLGMMTVILSSLNERRREIAILRALGAKQRHIVTQFLVETVVLSVGGGLLGVAVGLSIPLIVERFADMRTIVTPGAPLIAFGISAGVGVIFGLYPAWRAAAMDPVEALRHE